MDKLILDLGTPGVSQVTIPANVSNDDETHIEIWTPGKPGCVVDGVYYSGVAGSWAQGDYSLPAGTQLTVKVGDSAPYNQAGYVAPDITSVRDSATSGDLVTVESGADYGPQSINTPTISGSARSSSSSHLGGSIDTFTGDGTTSAGGSSSGGPTADGNTPSSSGITAGASAGVDSGAGGDGATATADGQPGAFPSGGGGGGTSSRPGGASACGRVRITIPIAIGLPQVIER